MKDGWSSIDIIISSYAFPVNPPPISLRILNPILINPLSHLLARAYPLPHSIFNFIIAIAWIIKSLALVLARAFTLDHSTTPVVDLDRVTIVPTFSPDLHTCDTL